MAGIFRKFLDKFKSDDIDWDGLEETLIKGDIGVRTAMDIVEALQIERRNITEEDILEITRREVLTHLPRVNPALQPHDDRPFVILMIGVNGTGKTTTSAKLANYLRYNGHSVMLAAADTFRAAAIEQLQIWGERLSVPVVTGSYKADPGSVCFQAYQQAAKENIDFLICDTAGRLHTRHNLMQELEKIERVVRKQDHTAPHESFLVVDATTGSNALSQAKEFQTAVKSLTGVIITKLDGSGRGGIAVPIRRDLQLPTRFIGYGEAVENFYPFEARWFVDNLIRDESPAPNA